MISPDNAELYVALGAALASKDLKGIPSILGRLILNDITHMRWKGLLRCLMMKRSLKILE